jgi:hypothetical protein
MSIALIALAFTVFPVNPQLLASAGVASTLSCKFNNSGAIKTEVIDHVSKIYLNWSDGPQMSYTLMLPYREGANFYKDSLGGTWEKHGSYYPHTLLLINTKNGNTIRCK